MVFSQPADAPRGLRQRLEEDPPEDLLLLVRHWVRWHRTVPGDQQGILHRAMTWLAQQGFAWRHGTVPHMVHAAQDLLSRPVKTPASLLHPWMNNPFWRDSPDHPAWGPLLDLLRLGGATLDARLRFEDDHDLEMGNPTLLCAAIDQFPRVAMVLLLDRGIMTRERVRAPQYWSHTILHRLAGAGLLDLVRHAITAGADLNANDDNGDTPLINAALFGHTPVVHLLLAAGADPTFANRPERRGNTALHVAAEHCNLDVMRTLIEAGVAIDVPNAHGDTALDLVRLQMKNPDDMSTQARENGPACLALLHENRVARERAVLLTALPSAWPSALPPGDAGPGMAPPLAAASSTSHPGIDLDQVRNVVPSVRGSGRRRL